MRTSIPRRGLAGRRRGVLPNSVPGFGHGIGIVRGGLPDRGSRYLIPGALTPLLYAARDGRLESARLLVDAGANVEAKDANGITPLLMAIANNHIDVARFLIEQGADDQRESIGTAGRRSGRRSKRATRTSTSRHVGKQRRPRAVARV